jgi:hypothetical protein
MVTLSELQQLFRDALEGRPDLRLLVAPKLDEGASRDFHKLLIVSSCGCGTSALLSVEVDRKKTLPEVQKAMPHLLSHINAREQAFRNMSCEIHGQMRTGSHKEKRKPVI